jgi:hypothetical protein
VTANKRFGKAELPLSPSHYKHCPGAQSSSAWWGLRGPSPTPCVGTVKSTAPPRPGPWSYPRFCSPLHPCCSPAGCYGNLAGPLAARMSSYQGTGIQLAAIAQHLPGASIRSGEGTGLVGGVPWEYLALKDKPSWAQK